MSQVVGLRMTQNAETGSVSGAAVKLTQEKEQILFHKIQSFEPKLAVLIILDFLDRFDTDQLEHMSENSENLLERINEVLGNVSELKKPKTQIVQSEERTFRRGQSVLALWNRYWLPAIIQGPGPDNKFFILLKGYKSDGQYLVSKDEIKTEEEAVMETCEKPNSPLPVTVPTGIAAPQNTRPQLNAQAQLYNSQQNYNNMGQFVQRTVYHVPQQYVPSTYFYYPNTGYVTPQAQYYPQQIVMRVP